MPINKNITRVLALIVISLNSYLLFSKQLGATALEIEEKNPPESINLFQENSAETNSTEIVEKINNISRQITVKIDNLTDKSNGSGVIIAHQRDTYYVLTAKQVLCTNSEISECEVNGQHQIVTPDGGIYQLDSQTVRVPAAEIDLALVKFKSDKTYNVATMADYQWSKQWVFVSGFTNHTRPKNSLPSHVLTAGKVFPKEQADFVVKDIHSLKGGIELVYTNNTYPGMGGGAVLDTQGRLIGIHTGTESELKIDEEGNYQQLNLGYSLGIPIKTWLSFLDKDLLRSLESIA